MSYRQPSVQVMMYNV